MTNKKIILQNSKEIVPSILKYQDNISLSIISNKDLLKGTILFTNKSEIYLDFGTKPIIKVSKKLYVKNLIQLYIILNTSYLQIERPLDTQHQAKIDFKNWIREKLTAGQTISLVINTIDSIKNIHTIDFKKSLKYIKRNKFFYELENIKNSRSTIKGFITNTVKGGFSVALGSLIAFLPFKEVVQQKKKKKTNKTIYKNFVRSSMDFKISKINIYKNNVVLMKSL
jgi:ribosomal protein S1